MQEHSILDEEKEPQDIIALIEKQKKKYLIRAVILTVLNITLYIFVMPKQVTGGDAAKTALMGQGIGFPLLSFILALPVTLIPYKNLSYTEKYVRTSLLIFYVFTIIMAIMLLFNSVFIAAGVVKF